MGIENRRKVAHAPAVEFDPLHRIVFEMRKRAVGIAAQAGIDEAPGDGFGRIVEEQVERRADHGDLGPLGELLARAILDNLYKFVVPAIAGPARLVPLPALATPELSANALRVAAMRGRLKAAKASDGSWRSSTAWVEEYRASRYKRS